MSDDSAYDPTRDGSRRPPPRGPLNYQPPTSPPSPSRGGMNSNARDAVVAVCLTAVIITAVIVTKDATWLWLLFMLAMIAL